MSMASASSQNFDTYFEAKTLRLDYIFSGDSHAQDVSLSSLSQLPHWAGRKGNLSTLLRAGNGQITLVDIESGESIYKESFSSLFQEWLSTPEAEMVKRSFENTFLVPFPRKKVLVEVSFRNEKGLYESKLKHIVDPEDILIKKKGLAHIPAYTVVHKADDADKCINVVIVAEGYTSAEMLQFRAAAEVAVEQLFMHTPFNKYSNRFNILAVETVSEDSGVSVPRMNEWKSTALSSHFDTFYSDRYLTTTNVFDIHDAISGIPYAHIIILANTNVYGGGGIYNAYTLTTTGHKEFKPVVVHEFGHSFGGLADEYYYEGGDIFDDTYPLDVEPWEPNITTLTDFASKWQKLLKKDTPVPTSPDYSDKYPLGVYEGGGYSGKGIYRPAIDCRMKTNTCKDFCPACQAALESLIKFYTE
jgi:hypothetical protein